MKKSLIFSIVALSETFLIYLLVITPTEYLLTEKNLILKFIDPRQKTQIFLLIFVIVFLINYFWSKLRKAGEKFWPILAGGLLIALLANQVYVNFYNKLQENPKIYSLSSDWSIVGMEIEIDGKNFGPAWQGGQVLVNSFPLQIKDWAEEKITIIQPHPPEYFQGEIYIRKENQKESNRLPFTIRNPGELHQE
ncbi:MAG: hypothetical protein PHX72_00625 [Candidatus Shapirobacteria bacterium]|nr:hypothetical protein [Candidatus Shapirobacteria bacterium]